MVLLSPLRFILCMIPWVLPSFSMEQTRPRVTPSTLSKPQTLVSSEPLKITPVMNPFTIKKTIPTAPELSEEESSYETISSEESENSNSFKDPLFQIPQSSEESTTESEEESTQSESSEEAIPISDLFNPPSTLIKQFPETPTHMPLYPYPSRGNDSPPDRPPFSFQHPEPGTYVMILQEDLDNLQKKYDILENNMNKITEMLNHSMTIQIETQENITYNHNQVLSHLYGIEGNLHKIKDEITNPRRTTWQKFCGIFKLGLSSYTAYQAYTISAALSKALPILIAPSPFTAMGLAVTAGATAGAWVLVKLT